MPPLVVDAMMGFRASLLASEQAAMQEMARRWLRVEGALQAQLDALALELAQTPGRVTTAQLVKLNRYQALMEQARDELRKYERYMEPLIRDGQQDMITTAIRHSEAAIRAAAADAQIDPTFNRLPVEAVENMVGLIGDGSPLRPILASASRVGADALGDQLVRAVALGVNPREAARRAMRLGLGQSYTRMATIFRTETLRAYRETTREAYRESGVVKSYQRQSARDRRVCAACVLADGRIYQLGESFDQHPNCRCVLLPVLRGVSTAQEQDGQAWFRSQPEATQRRILGPGRFAAWQSGRATLDDLVTRDWSDTWGGSLRVTRVRDLV